MNKAEYIDSLYSIYFPRRHLGLSKKYEIVVYNDYNETTKSNRIY